METKISERAERSADPVGAQLRSLPLPSREGAWGRVCQLAQRVSDFFRSIEVTKDPIHPQFIVVQDGWFWNRVARPNIDPDHKVQVFFNRTDLALLDECPFHCKFADNLDESKSFEFCGFAYPKNKQQMEELERWATRFQDASVFTFGEFDNRGRWREGTFVKSLNSVGMV
jgi:glutaredoxin